jgi:hypothetical protein
MGWEDFKFQLVQIDSSKKMKESKWIAVCESCQCERVIGYAQAWNIKTGKYKNHCLDCKDRNPNSDLTAFKSGHFTWNKGINYKSNKSYEKDKVRMEIINTFGGIVFTQEIKEKQRNAKLNKFSEDSNAWAGGKTSERILLMSRDNYKALRKECFNRDNYTCQICNIRGGNLEMDHIKEWCNYPELRYEISNMRTLCKDCHKTTDNYSFKAVKGRVS